MSVRSITASVLLASALTVPLFAASATIGSATEEPKTIPGQLVYRWHDDRSIPARVPARPRSAAPDAPQANITVIYHGFSPAEQAAFQRAVDIWESIIDSPVEIKIDATYTALPPNVLGGARAAYGIRNFTGAPKADTFYPAALANKLAGTDLNRNEVDVYAEFSSALAADFYFGVDGNPPVNKLDFVSLALHEVGHGLGFTGSMRVQAGQGSWGGTGFVKYPGIYDHFTENGAGQALIDSTLFPNPSVALATQLQSGNLFFDGPITTAANGGVRPKLFAPTTWEPGSSYSHLDENLYPPGHIDTMMTPLQADGEVSHDAGPITRGVLADIGWTVTGGGGAGGSTRLVLATPLATGSTMVYCYTSQGAGRTSWFLTDTAGAFAYTSLSSSGTFKPAKGKKPATLTAKDSAGIRIEIGGIERVGSPKMSSKLVLGGMGSVTVTDKAHGRRVINNAPVQAVQNELPCVGPARQGASSAELLATLSPIERQAIDAATTAGEQSGAGAGVMPRRD